MRELCYIHSGKSVTVKTVLQNHFCLSRASVSALKNSGGISVNGENVTVRRELSEGDRLTLKFFDKPCEIIPTNMDIDILYEDEDILAVNKPCGIPTHPSRGHYTDTLANGICYYYRNENFVFYILIHLIHATGYFVQIRQLLCISQNICLILKAIYLYITYKSTASSVSCSFCVTFT